MENMVCCAYIQLWLGLFWLNSMLLTSQPEPTPVICEVIKEDSFADLSLWNCSLYVYSLEHKHKFHLLTK